MIEAEKVAEYMGRTTSAIESINKSIDNIGSKMDDVKQFQASTEERLKGGAAKFLDHEKRIDVIEKKEFPIGVVIALITLGILILGLILAKG